MNRGVAQPYFINLNNRTDIDINQIDNFSILFQQMNTTIIKKFVSNQDIDNGTIKIMLSAEETLKFYVGKCTIIIDGVLNDGTLFNTILAYEDINDIYKDDADNLINSVSAEDNGKVLGVQNGKAAFITPSGGGGGLDVPVIILKCLLTRYTEGTTIYYSILNCTASDIRALADQLVFIQIITPGQGASELFFLDGWHIGNIKAESGFHRIYIGPKNIRDHSNGDDRNLYDLCFVVPPASAGEEYEHKVMLTNMTINAIGSRHL